MSDGSVRHAADIISVRIENDQPQRSFANEDVAFVPVTRFNLRLNSSKNSRSAHLDGRHLVESAAYDAFWQHRIDLFERVCLPSLLHLSPRPDAWFIAFGDTRPTYIQELLGRLADYPWIRPYFRTKGHPEQKIPLETLIGDHIRPLGKRYLCSTRFDSDDSLHQQFFGALDKAVSRLREQGVEDELRCLNLLYGLVASRGELSIYLRRTMFSSVFEPVDGLQGPYRGAHDNIRMQMPLIEIVTNLPMWIYHRHQDTLDPPGVIVRDRLPLPATEPYLAPFGLTPDSLGISSRVFEATISDDLYRRATEQDELAGSLQTILDAREQQELASLVPRDGGQTNTVVLVTASTGSDAELQHRRAVNLVEQGFAAHVVTLCGSGAQPEMRDGVAYARVPSAEAAASDSDAHHRMLTRDLAELVAALRPCLLATDRSTTAQRAAAAVGRAFSIPVEF